MPDGLHLRTGLVIINFSGCRNCPHLWTMEMLVISILPNEPLERSNLVS